MLSARRQASQEHHGHDGTRTVRRLLAMARQGLAVMRAPVPAAAAVFFQTVGWTLQLLAVWAVTEAFDMDVPLPAAARRAAADERGHDLPALAGQHRPLAGRRGASAAPLRRPLRHGLRLRARAAGARDVRRRRRRPGHARARGPLARLAAPHGGGGGRLERERARGEASRPTTPSASRPSVVPARSYGRAPPRKARPAEAATTSSAADARAGS